MKDHTYQEALLPFQRFVKKSVFKAFILISLLLTFFTLIIVGALSSLDFLTAFAIASLLALILISYIFWLFFQDELEHETLQAKKEIIHLAKLSEDDFKQSAEVFEKMALLTQKMIINYDQSFFQSFFNRFTLFFFWPLFHILGETFFFSAIECHISMIKHAPTDLQEHAALANCYISLANHYQEPMKTSSLSLKPGLFVPKRLQAHLETKSKKISERAIEELTILSSFAPDQLWVHSQLALSFKELGMAEKEINECQEILRLCPDDPQALLRLGILYFQEGKSSKGLEVYEQLKFLQPQLSEELINHYGSYSNPTFHL